MSPLPVSRRDLEVAFRSCDCTGSLDEALRFPALAIALKNVSEVIKAGRLRKSQRIDYKRATAGDFDD